MKRPPAKRGRPRQDKRARLGIETAAARAGQAASLSRQPEPRERRRLPARRPLRDDHDQYVIDVAAVLELAGLEPWPARKQALALLEGHEVIDGPRKVPRGGRHRTDLVHVTYLRRKSMPSSGSFKSRDWTLRRKLKAGALRPRRAVVLLLALALPLKPEVREAILRLLERE